MALIVNNLITKGMSGRYGKVLVFKQYRGKTVATAYPTPTNKPPTPLQVVRRQKFAKAVAMTKLWLQNPEQNLFLERLADKWDSLSAYHAGIKYFMLNQPSVPFPQEMAENNTVKKSHDIYPGQQPMTEAKTQHLLYKKPRHIMTNAIIVALIYMTSIAFGRFRFSRKNGTKGSHAQIIDCLLGSPIYQLPIEVNTRPKSSIIAIQHCFTILQVQLRSNLSYLSKSAVNSFFSRVKVHGKYGGWLANNAVMLAVVIGFS